MQPTHFHCQTINQPSSHGAIRSKLSKRTIADLLGYNPAGDTVARIYDALVAGNGVEVFTAKHGQRGTDGTAYRLLPCTADFPEGELPKVSEIVQF